MIKTVVFKFLITGCMPKDVRYEMEINVPQFKIYQIPL